MAQLGRYELLRKIASGGMATVYLGRVVGEGGFERLVALKVMHPHIAADPEFIAMFLDEARLAARIRHPNVVPTLDVHRDEDRAFLVMDYIDGAALHDLHKTAKKKIEWLPRPIIYRVMLDTLEGLHAAHELTSKDGTPLNIVHRDVSPQNILVGTDGIARITDFGVARAEERISSTRGGQIKGKLHYMPPEQIFAEALDRRADVYAAGLVLWQLLTNRRPIRADNEGALVHQIVAGIERKPSSENEEIPPEIDAVVMQAIARSASNRFASTAIFAEALERAAIATGEPPANRRAVGKYVSAQTPTRSVEIDQDLDVSNLSSKQDVVIQFTDSRTRTDAVLPAKPDDERPPRSRLAIFLGAAALAAGVVASLAWSFGRDEPIASPVSPASTAAGASPSVTASAADSAGGLAAESATASASASEGTPTAQTAAVSVAPLAKPPKPKPHVAVRRPRPPKPAPVAPPPPKPSANSNQTGGPGYRPTEL